MSPQETSRRSDPRPVNSKSFVSQLRREPDPLRMKMLLLGYITERLEKKNQAVFLVGGQAVETYTAGQFPTGDMDITTTDAPETEKVLKSLGFRQIGMVWLNKRLNIAFHIVGYFPPERSRTIKVGPYDARIISVEELILDRLSAAKFWNIPADYEKAKVLFDNFRKQIDMKYLREMAEKKNIGDLFQTLNKSGKIPKSMFGSNPRLKSFAAKDEAEAH